MFSRSFLARTIRLGLNSFKLLFYKLITRPTSSEKVRLFRCGIPLVMKKSLRTISTEADALHFLHSTKRGLPIPRVIDSFMFDNKTYTIMTKIPGKSLLDLQLSEDEVAVVARDVLQFLYQLWDIKQPIEDAGHVMMSASRHGLPDPVTFHELLGGPFQTTSHCYARLAQEESVESFESTVSPSLLRCLLDDDIVWVHTDLRMQNVLVVNGRLSGVIDWEDSGWLPRHWQLHILRWPFAFGMGGPWMKFFHAVDFPNKSEAAYVASKSVLIYPL